MDEREGALPHVEFERVRHRDHGFAPVAVFEQRELEGCGAADEEPAATASLLLRDPLAAAVLANQKERGGRHGHLLFRSTGDFARRCPQSRETAAAAM